MPKTIDQLITELINREGGSKYTDDPADAGGPTKYGVTQGALAKWRGHPVSADDVKNLQEPEARAIYKHNYIIEPGYDELSDPRLVEQLIDAGVNHGTGSAIKMLQRAIGVPADGVMGPKTVAQANRMNQNEVIIRFVARRSRFYGAILSLAGKTGKARQQALDNRKFAAGWFNRVADMIGEYADETFL